MANANQVIVKGETILDLRSDTVTPETLQKGYTAHDKSGTKITGTLEASSSGAAKETWVLEKTPSVGRIDRETTINFTSNDTKYSKIQMGTLNVGGIRYDDTKVYDIYGSDDENLLWLSSAYRKLTFDTPPTGALLTWLQANGVKQPDDTAVQDSKALTITSNGTVSVTPDAPYDALKKVDVTVDVVSDVPLVTVTFKATVYGDEINSPGENEIAEMKRIIISAFVAGNISLANMYDFSTQLGGMVFPFNVVVPQGSSVTICASGAGAGGSTTVTNAQIAKCFGIEGINAAYTIYNITDGATITIDVT